MNQNDVEKGSVFGKDQVPSPDYNSSMGGEPNYVVGANGRVFNPDNAAAATATSPLARRLKSRHLQMIAIGGSIGRSPYS